jgi:hypothetical protein
MEKVVHASTVIDQAINDLVTLKKALKEFGGLAPVAPVNEHDFVPWFITAQRALGVRELTGLQLEQAAQTFNIQLTKKGGYWIKACGFEKNRAKAGLRWYDITATGLEQETHAPDLGAWAE